MDKQLIEMRNMEIKLLIIEYNKASQLDRSFSKNGLSGEVKNQFRRQLLSICIDLMQKIDDGTLKNASIRNKIKELTNISPHISFGQAQKVVNVSLKQYCFISNNIELLKELDCPLDTITMHGYRISHKRMINVNEEDYIKYQNEFEKQFNGLRILKDREYDEMRISEFLRELGE